MKPDKTNRLILAFVVMGMLMVGVGSISANAQGRHAVRRPGRVIVYRHYNPYWYGCNRFYNPFWDPFYYSSYQVVDPVAYQTEKGYRDGRNQGKEDAKKARPAVATDNKNYSKSDSIHYREAFVKGYKEAYPAKVAEIKKDLIEKGRSKGKADAKKGRPANPTVHEDYAKATSPAYRQAFVQGYNERYRQQINESRERSDD
jgi:hypothetical protein